MSRKTTPTTEQERAAFGLSPEERALLSDVRASLVASSGGGAVWARIQAESERSTRFSSVVRLAWWQLVAEPARLLVPTLTTLLIIAAEWFSVLLPHHRAAVEAWAVMAPWLGVWVFASGAEESRGALSTFTVMAPRGRGQRQVARWVGAAGTSLVSIVLALSIGAAATGQVSTWAVVAAAGFSASLAAGLLGAALFSPRRSQTWAVMLGGANLVWVLAAAALGRPDLLPVLLLVKAPVVATIAGILAVAVGSALGLRIRWIRA